MAAVPEAVGTPDEVLADNGYATEEEVAALTDRGLEVLVAMQAKLAQAEHRASYRVRQHTVEPVFGIMKHAMGFRQFLLRGHAKVTGEWQLLALAYNCKRLHNLQLA